MTPETEALHREVIERERALLETRARIRQMEMEDVQRAGTPSAPVLPAPVPPAAPAQPLQVQAAAPPAAPQPAAPPAPAPAATLPVFRPLTPADFPRATSAHTPVLAGPGTVAEAENVAALTSMESIRNGTYAQNRDRLLGLLGKAHGQEAVMPPGHRFPGAPGGPQAQPAGTDQFHGHPTTGPMSPALAAKIARQRANKQGR